MRMRQIGYVLATFAVLACAVGLLAAPNENERGNAVRDADAEVRGLISELDGRVERLRVARRIIQARQMYLVMSGRYREGDEVHFPDPQQFHDDVDDVFADVDTVDADAIVYYGPYDHDEKEDEESCRVLWHECPPEAGVRIIVFTDGHIEVAMRTDFGRRGE